MDNNMYTEGICGPTGTSRSSVPLFLITLCHAPVYRIDTVPCARASSDPVSRYATCRRKGLAYHGSDGFVWRVYWGDVDHGARVSATSQRGRWRFSFHAKLSHSHLIVYLQVWANGRDLLSLARCTQHRHSVDPKILAITRCTNLSTHFLHPFHTLTSKKVQIKQMRI